jgi:hypothetical protein
MGEDIFKKLKKTFVGSNEIEVYGGDKGNFGYIYFIEPNQRGGEFTCQPAYK